MHKKQDLCKTNVYRGLLVEGNIEISNLLEDFYMVVELYDYIENNP